MKDISGEKSQGGEIESQVFWQRRASLVLGAVIALLSLWMLRSFLAAMVWATIIAIATWRPYSRVTALVLPQRRIWVAAGFVAVAALVFVLPLAALAIELGREAFSLAGVAREAQRHGIAVPDWLTHLPLVGSYLGGWWQANLMQPGAAGDFIGRLRHRIPLEWTPAIGIQLVHRGATLAFTLLILFFLYRDGLSASRDIAGLIERVFGAPGRRVATDVVAAVRGTVNGLVFVGLGEGVLLGIAYAVAGLPHPVALGAFTAILAVIPFGLIVIVIGAALVLLAQSSVAVAVALLCFGIVVSVIADHFLRPFLIGGATKLPFLWVLLGILGGLESFGLLGLFLGPVLMAALFTLWRETIGRR